MEKILRPSLVDETASIQEAIDDCFLCGGGQVTLCEGVYNVKTLRLRSNVTLYLKSGAHIVASRNIADYDTLRGDTVEPLPKEDFTDAVWVRGRTDVRDNSFLLCPASRWTSAVIRIIRARNVKIIGEEGSVIDGNNSYDAGGEENYRGAHGITLYHSENLEFRGYTIQNTGNWAHCGYFCKDIHFDGVTVLGGHDGIHVGASDNMTIENCDIHTGDDALAGFDIFNVNIRNCRLSSSCSAFRMGGTDILIENCTLGKTRYGFRGGLTPEEKENGVVTESIIRKAKGFFTYYADGTLKIRRRPGNITVRNCVIDGANRFLHFNFSGNEKWQLNRPLGSITFENVKAYDIDMSLCLYGDASDPGELTLRDCELEFTDAPTELVRAYGYKRITLENVKVTGVSGPAVRSWGADGSLCTDALVGAEPSVVHETEPFSCKAI